MRLVEVDWNPESRWYVMRVRSDESQPWSTYDGSEDEVDDLLSLVRDTMTGG